MSFYLLNRATIPQQKLLLPCQLWVDGETALPVVVREQLPGVAVHVLPEAPDLLQEAGLEHTQLPLVPHLQFRHLRVPGRSPVSQSVSQSGRQAGRQAGSSVQPASACNRLACNHLWRATTFSAAIVSMQPSWACNHVFRTRISSVQPT